MKLLLDTHTLIWAVGMSPRLPSAVASVIRDPENDVWLSAASLYEIEYKRDRDGALARLPLDLIRAATTLPADWLDVTPQHFVTAGRLDRVHRDPWDRLIVAQAMIEGLTIVSVDPALRAFGVQTFW